jgi:hypothetical protein
VPTVKLCQEGLTEHVFQQAAATSSCIRYESFTFGVYTNSVDESVPCKFHMHSVTTDELIRPCDAEVNQIE